MPGAGVVWLGFVSTLAGCGGSPPDKGADKPGLDALLELSGEPIPAPPDVSAPPADAQKTESGLAYKVLEQGTGTERPSSRAAVTAHYVGWAASDGKMFDSSYNRGAHGEFALEGLMPGLSEGIQLMVIGQKNRFWVPEALGFAGMEGRPAGDLVFDVELLEINEPPPPIPPPPDVAAPPKTRSSPCRGWPTRCSSRARAPSTRWSTARCWCTSPCGARTAP